MSMIAVFQKNQLKQLFTLAVWPTLETGLEASAACSRGQDPRYLSQRTSIMSAIKHDEAALTGAVRRRGSTRLINWETRRANLQGSGDPLCQLAWITCFYLSDLKNLC